MIDSSWTQVAADMMTWDMMRVANTSTCSGNVVKLMTELSVSNGRANGTSQPL